MDAGDAEDDGPAHSGRRAGVERGAGSDPGLRLRRLRRPDRLLGRLHGHGHRRALRPRAAAEDHRLPVFGDLHLAGLRPNAPEFEVAANAIKIPVEFVFQWEDAVAPREHGLALFNAFGSAEKTMHINPGGHMDIPSFEGASWERFFVRHLGTADAPVKTHKLEAAE